MSDRLLSVGLDVGTTTTQLVVSQLTAQNKASAFAVPQMEITDRKVLYRGQVHFTPLLSGDLVDAQALRQIVTEEYAKAGIRPQDVDTGAIIITGETSRKENAAAVLQALSQYAGEFVVATAGPELESMLAAKGAGAVERSRRHSGLLLHMDIGGGTSNLALIEDGRIVRTGCFNVGGRLLKTDRRGMLTYISPVLQGLIRLQTGEILTAQQRETVAQMLTQALEMAAGLREQTQLLDQLMTKELSIPWVPPDSPVTVSFSGGVADCIEKEAEDLAFGDIGPALGRAIRQSRLCQQTYFLGEETIRATVIGAGCHSTQLSGSTVYYRDVALPVKNLPVAVFTRQEQESAELPGLIRSRLAQKDTDAVVLALEGYEAPTYAAVQRLAEAILAGVGDRPIWVCLQQDMAKALGHSLSLRCSPGRSCLCIDSLQLEENSFLDIGLPVGPCLPVVLKTLVLSSSQ